MLNLKRCAFLTVSVLFTNLMQLSVSQQSPFGVSSYPVINSLLPLGTYTGYLYPSDKHFQQELGLQTAPRAFLNLLSPIQPERFPPNLMAIKIKLSYLLSTNQLEVRPVINYLNKYQHLDQFDHMIAALLVLRDTLPTDCPLRKELGQLIVHSVFKRCQSRVIGRSTELRPILPTYPVIRPTYQLPCEIIISMINYFQSLSKQCNCQNCASSRFNNNLYTNAYQQFTKRNTQQIQRRRSVNLSRTNLLEKVSLYQQPQTSSFLPVQLIRLMPQPQNQMELVNYKKVQTLLKSTDINKYFRGLKVSDYENAKKLWNIILQKVAQSNLSADIKQAASFYLNDNREAILFDYSTLIELLPQPLDAEETEKFNIVKMFLHRKDIQQFLKHINASEYTDRKMLLKTVLRTLVSSKLDTKTIEAFTYYLNYQESLAPLELYTRKEITKHFELTKIFMDTLDINSISDEAKLAFKKFFKFISNVTKNQIKSFDTWSDVKTKGEFMKVLFKYFLTQTFVPQEVKESITKLEPLVKMDGKGAAPP